MLIIMIGAQGSGKSTFSKKHLPKGGVIVSSDSFLSEEGEYHWTPERAQLAHERCKKLAFRHLEEYTPFIILDNTNPSMPAIQPYLDKAKALATRVLFVWMDTGLETCLERQTHGAPAVTVERVHEQCREFAAFLRREMFPVLAVQDRGVFDGLGSKSPRYQMFGREWFVTAGASVEFAHAAFAASMKSIFDRWGDALKRMEDDKT